MKLKVKIKFIYKIIPILVFYTDWLQKSWTAGRSFGVFIVLRPKYYEKENPILEHELTHCKQFYRTLGLYSLLYSFRKYRLKVELEAYEAQVKNRGYSKYVKKWVTKTLFNNYNLGIVYKELEEIVFNYYR